MYQIPIRKGMFTGINLHNCVLISRPNEVDLIHNFFFLNIHSLATTLKSRLLPTFFLNFHEIGIATLRGRPEQNLKSKEQDSESSPKQIYRSECVAERVKVGEGGPGEGEEMKGRKKETEKRERERGRRKKGERRTKGQRHYSSERQL